MNFFKKWIFYSLFSVWIVISITNCSQNSDITSVNNENQIGESLVLNFSDSSYHNEETEDFQQDSCTLNYIQNIDEYTAGSIEFENGSFLKIPVKSLTPPEELSGKNVVITMAVNKDSVNNELNFTFGPHGCEFKIPAKLCLSWKQLNCERATLYYLDESGNRKEHLPEQVDYSNKRMILQIKHFSRYAVAYSN